MHDLDRGNKHFGLKLRAQEFIIKYKDGRSVLDRGIFESALYIHQEIMKIPGLLDICFSIKLPGRNRSCLVSSPLEILSFNSSLKFKSQASQ